MDAERENELKNITEQVAENVDMALIEQAVIGNSIEFDINDKKYKVSKPTFGQKQEAFKRKINKFSELIKDPNMLLEKDLRKQYKERGIDLEEMQNKILNLEKQKQNLQLQLGELIVREGVESDLEHLKSEIQKIYSEQVSISVEKSMLLEFSIENQVFEYTYSYLTFLITEKLEGEKWVRLWKQYEDFENENSNLVQKISVYATLVMKDEINL